MSRSALLLIALLPLANACQPAAQDTPDADTIAAAEASIRQDVANFDAAVHAEDIEAMMSRYHPDAVRMNPNLPAAVGIAAIRQLFLEGWAANDFEVTNELTDLYIEGSLAAGRGTYTVRVIPADGSAPYDDAGTWSSVWQQQADGSWKALWDIWNSGLPPRPAVE